MVNDNNKDDGESPSSFVIHEKYNKKRNQEVALESIRPYLQKDGGDVEFIELTEVPVADLKELRENQRK